MNIQFQPHALTPYFYPRIAVNATNCTPDAEANYNEYNLFCLKTRLQPFLLKNQLNQYSLQFVPVERGPRIYIGVMLSDAGDRIKLDDKQTRQLVEQIKDITTVSPTSCLLYSADNTVWLPNNHRIPTIWTASVLPYLPIDRQLNPYIDNGNLFVDLSNYAGHAIYYNNLYTKIEDDLRKYYLQGAIVCNATFARQWELSPHIILGYDMIEHSGELLEDEAIAQLTDDNGLYLPTWRDTRFAPDQVTFLLERMAGETSITLEIPLAGSKIAVSDYLRDLLPSLGGKYTINQGTVNITGITSLSRIREIITTIANLPPSEKIPTLVSSRNQGYSWVDLTGQPYSAVSTEYIDEARRNFFT